MEKSFYSDVRSDEFNTLILTCVLVLWEYSVVSIMCTCMALHATAAVSCPLASCTVTHANFSCCPSLSTQEARFHYFNSRVVQANDLCRWAGHTESSLATALTPLSKLACNVYYQLVRTQTF